MMAGHYIPYNQLPESTKAEHIEMAANPVHSSSPLPSPYHHDKDLPAIHSPQPPNIDDLPPGAAVPIPRFYGSAQYDDPIPRSSYASSLDTASLPYDPSRGFDNSSSYALHPYSDDITSMGGPAAMAAYRDDPAISSAYYAPSRSISNNVLQEKRNYYDAYGKPRRKGLLIGGILIGILVLTAAVVIPIYFLVLRKNTSSLDPNSSDPSSPGAVPSPTVSQALISGGDGSEITLEDGRKIKYTNKFGGYWVYDSNNPFNNGARPQKWSPALNETFRYGVDKIRGVNLGGWLVTEPFIVPALYEKYYASARPVDEWTLATAMSAANSLEADMEQHYKTFITEEDFAQIAAAGLNFVRIPIGYWAIEVRDGEPFLAKTSWTYFLKAIGWARKYGIRINLDVHALPGSQNAWNHSGRIDILNWLHGPVGFMNAQRSLGYIRTIAQFICQPQYKDVITIFGIINEPRAQEIIGVDVLSSWYFEAYNIIKNICGTGEGKGPYVSLHNGFASPSKWVGLYPNADRVALDMHPYIAFNDVQSTSTPNDNLAAPCNYWGDMTNTSQRDFGLTTAGEWSLAINDCGKWVNGVDLGARYDGSFSGSSAVGNCDSWNDWTTWSPSTKSGFLNFALTSMDALQNYFFWTWKIGNSTVTGKVEAPFWSYSLGLQNGWIPKDPRAATGACARAGVVGSPYVGPPKPWQTGGAGAGNIPAAAAAAVAWPPSNIVDGGPVSLLPSFTATGVNPTLPAPTQDPSATASIDFGNGWFNPQDTEGAYVPINGCSYPNAWATNLPQPNGPFCAGRSKK